jgi:adenosylcobinamide-GDP ribazoletransferase
MCVKALRALLQFTTILPLGKPVPFEYFARRSWLYPVAGYVTGGIAALAVLWIPSTPVAAAVAIALLLLISGCNHFDGLVDLGDGLMAHGEPERRIQAMTDRQTGAGGVAIGATTLLLTYAGLQESVPIIWTILIAEVGAAFSMVILTTFGTPFRDGIHSFLHGFARPYFPIFAAVLCIPLVLLPVPPARLAVAATLMVAVPLVLLAISRRLFGGVNGDVVGAGHELTRAAIIAAIVLILP